MDKLKVISYNAQGLKGKNKRAKVINWANRKKFDIMAIQESHFTEEQRTDWEKNWKGTIKASCWTSNKKGVTFLISEQLNHKLINEYKDKNGRWLVLDIEIDDQPYTLANYYGPNKDHTWHIDAMISKVDEINNPNIIICGDFNFVFNLNIDKLGGRDTTNRKCRKRVVEWMEEKNLLDIWRIKNPNSRKYTWTSNHKPPIKCRLDFILISESLAVNYKNCDIVPGFKSDHNCVTLNLENKTSQRGRGLWKFNSSLLQDEKFKEEIIKSIESLAQDNREAEDILLWDTMKCCLRGNCIGYAISKSKKEKKILRDATNNIQNLESEQCEAIMNQASQAEIQEIGYKIKENKRVIEEKIEKDTRASAIRSKCEWYEYGDSSSKLFLNLERSKGNQKVIKRLVKADGTLTTNMDEILKEEEKYYNLLYSSSKIYDSTTQKVEDEIFNVNCPKISILEHEQLEKEIGEEEVWNIIKDSPKNKSPGTDGFTNEFYQTFWPQLKKYMINAFNAALERGELSVSQKRGVITLIPKPQKDLDLLKNWRPITLLNQDYKYLAKVLANRCKKLMPDIISPDQTGFVPGRYIGCNIQRIQSLIDRCEEENIDGILLNIDFEKAFDSIDWNFILKALRHFNFPEKFLKWIKSFYTNIETSIVNNGHMSNFFQPQRGVRQGCPLSPYLFVIAAEILSLYIKQNIDIRGIKTSPTEDYTVSQFADDTSIALHCSKPNILNTLDALEKFSITSGLKINVDKSEILLLGGTSGLNIPNRLKGLVKEEVKILGIKIQKDRKLTTETNYREVLEKMKSSIECWSRRSMSLAGKICIIKTMITSKLMYCVNNLASPDEKYWKEVEEILYNFVNNGKPDKIKRETLIAPYEEGGYRMLDIRCQNKAMKLSWGNRLVNNEGVWKAYMLNKSPVDIEYMLRCNILFADLPFNMPVGSLWQEFWRGWCTQNFKEDIVDLEGVLNQNIWFNSNIRVQNKPIYYKNWADHGIRWINQLTKEDLEGKKRILKHQEFEDLIDSKVPILQYHGLISAIPKSWKRLIYRAEDQDMDIEDYKLIDRMRDSSAPTKLIYNSLISKKLKNPQSTLEKWRTDLNINTANEQVLRPHAVQRKLIMNNVIKSFNYKFLMRIVPTGRRLYLLGIKDTENCNICHIPESILHLYWLCPSTRRLWERLKVLIEEKFRVLFPITKEKCLLGIGQWITQSKKEEIQMLCIWTKYYIHLNKCAEEKTSNKGLDSFIKTKLRIEKAINWEKGRGNLYQQKWGNMITWSEEQ